MRRLLALLLVTAIACAPTAPPKPKSEVPPTPEKSAPEELPAITDSALLAKRIASVLDDVHGRDLLTTHGFWTVFHGILGMGPDTMLTDPVTHEKVSALERVRSGKGIRGLEFVETPTGIDVVTMPGTGVGQGHQDQFVAEMVEWSVPLDTKFKVNDKDYTFADFCKHSKERASVTRDQELSWALVIVSKVYGTDHRWKNMYGEKLSLEDIAQYEATQPIKDAACGGTHRLYGLTWAYHLHLASGGKTTGVWRKVADRLAEYSSKAKRFQNPDGSFSSDYVSSGPSWTRNNEKQIASTGHVFEWLCEQLPDSELREPWMERAAYALTSMILEKQSYAIDGGALYHATHGLHMYQHRVFGVAGPRGLTIPALPKS